MIDRDDRDIVLHCLDLAMMHEFDDAKRLLEPLDDAVAGRLFLLICDLEQREQARARAVAVTRHEIGNALSIAQANLEGMADGVVEATPQRLEAVVRSLRSVGALLDDLRRIPARNDAQDVGSDLVALAEIIEANIAASAGLAGAKSVRVLFDRREAPVECHGDAAQIHRMIRKALVDAVRYAPPRGSVEISAPQAGDNQLAIAIRDASSGSFGALQRMLKIRLPVVVG